MVDASERQIDEPIYTPATAARYLVLPVSTVRWWTLGNGAHPPVIHLADPDEHLLSFRNVVEVHVLSAVMRQGRGRVPIAVVRAVVALLAERLGCRHPLAHPHMREDGKDFFAARFGALVNASPQVQGAIAATVAAYVERVGRDERGDPARLLLCTRGRADDPGYVMLDPDVKSGEPCIAGTSIATRAVAQRFQAGTSVQELAELYARTTAEIEEAVRYQAELR